MLPRIALQLLRSLPLLLVLLIYYLIAIIATRFTANFHFSIEKKTQDSLFNNVLILHNSEQAKRSKTILKS